MKNPIIAALLNVIPGLGYIYVGSRRMLGITLVIFCVLSVVTQNAYDTFLYNNFAEEDLAIPVQSGLGYLYSLSIFMILILINVFMYDAYRDAKNRNIEIAGSVKK